MAYRLFLNVLSGDKNYQSIEFDEDGNFKPDDDYLLFGKNCVYKILHDDDDKLVGAEATLTYVGYTKEHVIFHNEICDRERDIEALKKLISQNIDELTTENFEEINMYLSLIVNHKTNIVELKKRIDELADKTETLTKKYVLAIDKFFTLKNGQKYWFTMLTR
jgi:hypothetical protein